MKKRLFAGVLASIVLGAAFTLPAAASCRDNGNCFNPGKSVQKQAEKETASAKTAVKKKVVAKAAAKKVTAKTAVKKVAATTAVKKTKTATVKRKKATAVASGPHHGNSDPVVAMIRSMAPDFGVPTWFALRIAKVESGYNPKARGSAGELGVYQLKCATAKGIGFRGQCSALLDARTNVRFGLKHLSLALKSSRGNLRLAASKHNGGLGRKTEVRGYVALVF